jgi:16S rRNA A1518/A1519 N6-dimethyltransferase RsmA/KsgA/DIM1 with predicted DNA glycosylase/AP lyase activity
MLYLVFLAINLGFALFIFFLCVAFAFGAPFVPSSKKASTKIIELARIKPGDTVYDLGSGNGKLLLLAAQKGATAIGYEINPYLVLFTKVRAFFSPYRTLVHVRWKNFWSADLTDAHAVFVYLIPWKMDSLERMLRKKLKPGTLIISNSFLFPHLTQIDSDSSSHVYVFSITKAS